MSKVNTETDEELREIIKASSRMMTTLVDSLRDHPDVQPAIVQLVNSEDMLMAFSELAIEDPDRMRTVLQAAIGALTNVQTVTAIDKEMQWRESGGN